MGNCCHQTIQDWSPLEDYKQSQLSIWSDNEDRLRDIKIHTEAKDTKYRFKINPFTGCMSIESRLTYRSSWSTYIYEIPFTNYPVNTILTMYNLPLNIRIARLDLWNKKLFENWLKEYRDMEKIKTTKFGRDSTSIIDQYVKL